MSDYWELAAHVVGMDPDDAYDKTDEIEERLDERWGIDLATFEHVADTLLRYTPSLTSPLSDQEMHVFGVWESQHIPDRPADDAPVVPRAGADAGRRRPGEGRPQRTAGDAVTRVLVTYRYDE